MTLRYVITTFGPQNRYYIQGAEKITRNLEFAKIFGSYESAYTFLVVELGYNHLYKVEEYGKCLMEDVHLT